MDWDPRKLFIQLMEYSKHDNEANNCNQLLENLYDMLTSQQQNTSDLDAYILHMFDKSHGLLNFVTKTANKKYYKTSTVNIMKILFTFINNFHFKLAKYITIIIEICLKILNSSHTNADEKIKALDVLIIGFEKTDQSLENQAEYKKLYNNLRHLFNLNPSPSVKQKVMVALGTFAQKFPYFVPNPDDLKTLFISQINFQIVQKNIAYSVIAGAFTGLMLSGENFPLQKNQEGLQELFTLIDKLLIPEQHSKVVNRAALSFLTSNITLFSSDLVKNYKRWHELLLKWFDFPSVEDKKIAYSTMSAFYQGLTLAEQIEPNVELVTFFMEYFTTTMQNKQIAMHEKKLCLQGICSFSDLFYKTLPNEQTTQLFIIVLQSFENLYIISQNQESEDSDYLPDYIKTLASFLQFRATNYNEILCLQRGVIYMIKIFPHIQTSHTNLVIESLATVFYYLKQYDLKKFNDFIYNTVYQGVIWSCTHDYIPEAELAENEKIITVKNYFNFWNGLLKIEIMERLQKYGINFEERKLLLFKVVENIIKTFMILINKLNITVERVDNTNSHLTDLSTTYKVTNGDDFAIFLNLVDLYEEIFEHLDPSFLRKCITKMVNHLILKCTKYDIISGFYKLLAACLKICNKLKMFDEQFLDSTSDITNCFESLTKFLEILLVKVKQFRDDLLIACLQVLLEYPTVILRESLNSCIPAFVLMFNIGKSYTRLALKAVETLECWQNNIEPEYMQPFLEKIFPILCSYLQSKSLSKFHQTKNLKNKRKTQRPMHKNKVILEIEPELIKLQRRILNFVGKQNNNLCRKFVIGNEDIQLAQWGNEQHLKISLPFEDFRLDLYLDTILPRVIHLALNSNDRKIRMAACELLHAIVMIFLGTTRQMNEVGLQDLNQLFKNLVFPLLQLGCDLDQLIQQLFQPLFLQLTHWYSHYNQVRGHHSAIFIEAMMDGITHPTDSALRDFSGQCINEFINWTIKQSQKTRLADDPIIFKVFTQKMRFYASHPDPAKKLGASLIFNNMYRLIREEQDILSMFWIEYLHIFLISLSSIHNNSDANPAIMQIKKALDHIQRVFTEKAHLFNKNDKLRRIPAGFESGLLKDIVIWILLQSGSSNSHCRQKALDLFSNIAPHTVKFSNLPNFINDNLSKDIVINIFESYLNNYPTVRELKDNDADTLLKWLKALACALDGYTFIIKIGLYKENVLSVNFIKSIRCFVSEIVFMSIEDTLNLVENNERFTSFHKQDFIHNKIEIVLKLLEFFHHLLVNAELKDNFQQFTNLDLWNLLTNLIFNPTNIGFDTFSSEPNNLYELLRELLLKIPGEALIEFTGNLKSYIQNNSYLDFELKGNVPMKTRNFMKGLIFLRSCQIKELNLHEIAKGNVDRILNKFKCNAENNTIFIEDLQDTTLRHCMLIFEFALYYEDEFHILVNAFYENYQVLNLQSNEPINFGYYILILFEEIIVKMILEHFSIFLSIKTDCSRQLELLIEIFQYILNEKSLKHFTEHVVTNIANQWKFYGQDFKDNPQNLECGLKLIKLLVPAIKIRKVQSAEIIKWLLKLLCDDNVDVNIIIDAIDVIADILEVNDYEEDLRYGLNFTRNKYFVDPSPNLFHKLLPIVPKIKTIVLLDFILKIQLTIKDNKIEIKEVLNHFITRTNLRLQEQSLNYIYDICFDPHLSITQRYHLFLEMVPLFHFCSLTIFEQFFCQHISKMISILEKPAADEEILLQKTIHFILLELMFLRTPIISSEQLSNITKAVDKSENKQLLQIILKFTLNTCKENFDFHSEFIRLYKCHSYNALVCIIKKSINDINFYLKLFARNENNVDVLWQGLIDVNKKYWFAKEFDEIPKKRTVLVNIRDNLRKNLEHKTNMSSSIKYLESQRAFNSSLKEDFTKYDFSNLVLRSAPIDDDDIINKIQDLGQEEIELDLVDINTHECMPTICGLIEHLITNGITELPTEDEDVENISLPNWIKDIRTILLNENTHTNVKIFWVKVIDNTIHIFKHYAKWFLEPLLKFVVDKSAGESLNYFVVDVIAILASWSTEICPESTTEIDLLEQVLIFLISQIDNDRQDIFKYHLELIKLIVEAWKDSIRVPYDLIFEKMNCEITSKKIEIGIHLTSIFLANKIAPWAADNYPKFCKKLFDIVLNSQLRSTYIPAAETLGLILKFISGEASGKFLNSAQLLLKKITDLDKYSCCLEAIVLRYSNILDSYNVSRILSKIHAVPPSVKTSYIKIILQAGQVLQDVTEFKTENWSQYLQRDMPEVQVLTLELIYKYLDILKFAPQFQEIIQSVCKHETNSNELCRSRMYDIIELICTNYKKGDKKLVEVYEICSKTLLNGIIDKDEEIRNKAYLYFEKHAKLPPKLTKRIPFIISNLYSPNTETNFIEYSTYFLLVILKEIDEYNQSLYDHPLEDCDFEDQNLRINWRIRHSSVVPLFAETLRSNEELPSFSNSNLNALRQTEDTFSFTPTQSVRAKQISQILSSQSSLFVSTGNDDDDKSPFINPNLVNISQKYKIPKRRFFKDKSKISRRMADYHVKKSIKEVKQHKDSAKESENKVTIFRKYRKGDFPDIEICLGALLDPTLALVLHDYELSKTLFTSVINNIINKNKGEFEFMDSLSTGIGYIFENSIQFNTNLFRTLFDVLLSCKNSLSFPPDIIASVSQSSGLVTIGSLILEQYLIHNDFEDMPTTSKKSRGFETNNNINYWVKLAELYKDMDEWDIVRAIFLEKMNCKDVVQDALRAESNKQWKYAQDIYQTLIENDESIEKKDFYYESYFKCFAHLGEWEKLSNTIEQFTATSSTTNKWENLLDNDWNQQKLLPWYIQANLKQILFNPTNIDKIKNDFEQLLNSNDSEWIENYYAEEFCMFSIYKNEVEAAKQYLRVYINNFLDNWQLLDPVYFNLRYNKMLRLRNIIDINKFLNFYEQFNAESTNDLFGLIKHWDETLEESLPSILLNETRVLYRRHFISLLVEKIKGFGGGDEVKATIGQLMKARYRMDADLIDTSLEQNNYYLARKYYNMYRDKNILRLQLSVNKFGCVKAQLTDDDEQKLAILFEALKPLETVLTKSNDMSLKLMGHLQQFQNLQEISKIFHGKPELFESNISKLSEILHITVSTKEGVTENSAQNLSRFLSNFEEQLNEAMETNDMSRCLKEKKLISDAYVKLVYFSKSHNNFDHFMLYILRAMKLESGEARQLFPCIIMQKNWTSKQKQQFVDEVKTIPPWMFLDWIPQLLVNIDSPSIDIVSPIILRIAKQYPQAIMYAYRLSKENFKFTDKTIKKSADILMEKLDQLLLSDQRIDKFLQALSFVSMPPIMLNYYIQRLVRACTSQNEELFLSINQYIMDNVFSCDPNSNDVSSLQGNLYKKIRNFKADLQKLKNYNNQKRLVELQKIFEKVGAIPCKPKDRDSKLLKNYCPWLASFTADQMDLELEIPGQYSGHKMPLPQYHVKISEFSPQVRCMESIRLPIKMTIVGNNLKEYSFLIKFGEDLRQDQRVEQLFNLMNNIFENDIQNQKGLSLDTYQVIPLTTSLGIIEWVEDTTQLEQFICLSLKKPDHLGIITNKYLSFLKFTNNSKNVDVYGKMAKTYKRDKIITNYRTLVNEIPCDVLRSSFLKLSANTDSYFALRTNFIKSYAVLCACHWILGIGDRHLQNFLISSKNGRVLGIDFGHAFGTATQLLGVPELVPFRLTPHIINLMEPIGERGLFRETMIHTLRSLRLNKNSLLATMQVFIEEPSLDWYEQALRLNNSDVKNVEWYPSKKIEQAKKKFEGANSIVSMIDDLQTGHQKHKDFMEAYINLVKGSPENDLRARINSHNLSIEEQVDCLLDHAGDYNLLGRMFHGWRAWV